MKKSRTPSLRRAVLGTSIATGLAMGGSAFAMTQLDGGYMLGSQAADSAPKTAEGACGEGKCGGAGKCGANAAKPMDHAGMFSAMDTNKDGKVSRAEFDAMHANMFQQADANKDGFITQEEMQAQHARMQGAKPGEGSCGNAKVAGEGKCGAGKCGASMKAKPADKPASKPAIKK